MDVCVCVPPMHAGLPSRRLFSMAVRLAAARVEMHVRQWPRAAVTIYCKPFMMQAVDRRASVRSTLPHMRCEGCYSRRHLSGTSKLVTSRRDLVLIIAAPERCVLHYSISFRCMEKHVHAWRCADAVCCMWRCMYVDTLMTDVSICWTI